MATPYFPEGHHNYKPKYRANTLIPGQNRDNNKEESENESV